MRKREMRELAIALEQVAEKYYDIDESAKALIRGLTPYLQKAKAGVIDAPVGRIPGGYLFDEGTLGNYDDLETAYADFSLSIKMHKDEYDSITAWIKERFAESDTKLREEQKKQK